MQPSDTPPTKADGADSAGWRDRAQAGIALAAHASDRATLDPLVRFLLDAGDTAVTAQTAEALLRRDDVAGLRPIVKAWASTDNHRYHDHLYGQLIRHLVPGGPIELFLDHCTALLDDPDPASGARQLLDKVQPWAQPDQGPELS